MMLACFLRVQMDICEPCMEMLFASCSLTEPVSLESVVDVCESVCECVRGCCVFVCTQPQQRQATAITNLLQQHVEEVNCTWARPEGSVSSIV